MKEISTIGRKINQEGIPQFLTGASITNVARLLSQHGVERKFWWRVVQ
jgi:hypothetical protein